MTRRLVSLLFPDTLLPAPHQHPTHLAATSDASCESKYSRTAARLAALNAASPGGIATARLSPAAVAAPPLLVPGVAAPLAGPAAAAAAPFDAAAGASAAPSDSSKMFAFLSRRGMTRRDGRLSLTRHDTVSRCVVLRYVVPTTSEEVEEGAIAWLHSGDKCVPYCRNDEQRPAVWPVNYSSPHLAVPAAAPPPYQV